MLSDTEVRVWRNFSASVLAYLTRFSNKVFDKPEEDRNV